jgi:hypothetical protein
MLRGMGNAEIEQSLRQLPQFQGGVSDRQVRRDVKQLEATLHVQVASNQLYSLQRAFAELDEAYRENWGIFHKPSQTDEIKLAAIDRIIRIVELRCKLAGFNNPKVLERFTLIQSAEGSGVRWERLSDQVERDADALRQNEDRRKREGIVDDQGD